MKKGISLSAALVMVLSLILTGIPAKAAGTATVTFDLNYEGAAELPPVTVSEGSILEEGPEILTRDGYQFAGWYTARDPVFENGISDQEWLFGEKYSAWSGATPEPGEIASMPVTEDLTLYARWVEPILVTTAEELADMKKDLTGWYVLANDIDLSGIQDWDPIGIYEAAYEWAEAAWWQNAFRGVLDGNGYTIKGLCITQARNAAGLFGAIANGQVMGLTIADYSITYNMSGSFSYAAPLVGFLQGSETGITGCHTSGTVNITLTDRSENTYAAATGLVGGGWAGSITDCTAAGSIRLYTDSKNGGEINAAGILGEGYSVISNCSTDVIIDCYAASQSNPGETGDIHLDIYAGGLAAGSTYVYNSSARGKITAGVSKDTGEASVNIGGITGSERYGAIEDCSSAVDIMVKEGRTIYAGGIIGSFHQTYGMIGYFFGVDGAKAVNCNATGKITIADGYKREAVYRNGIAGHVPEALIVDLGYIQIEETDFYSISDCTYTGYYTATAIWNNNGSSIPDSIELLLQMNGEDYGSPVSLSASDNWIASWAAEHTDNETISGLAAHSVPEAYTYDISADMNGNYLITLDAEAEPADPGTPPGDNDPGNNPDPETKPPFTQTATITDTMNKQVTSSSDGSSVATGDQNNTIFYLIVGIVMLGIIIGAALYRKRKKI